MFLTDAAATYVHATTLMPATLDHAVGAPAESGADEMDKLFTAGA